MKLAARISAIAVLLLLVFPTKANVKPAPVDAWPLWESYKSRFVSLDGRVVDWHENGRTTSEGQAYALFFALVANDRDTFSSVLRWTQVNLAQGSLRDRLPSWVWENSSSLGGAVRDFNSASDADLWMAYALITAGRVWNNAEYQSLGRSLAERIAKEEVVFLPNNGPMLMPGHGGFRPEPQVHILNPSYLPPQVLNGLAAEFPNGPWKNTESGLPKLLSPRVGNGFAMDWVEYRANVGYAAAVGPNGSTGGSYDAIRVYLWAGMLNRQTDGYQQLLSSLSGMEQYMRTHPIPPERVAPDGSIISESSPVGFSAATIPFLIAIGNLQAATDQEARLKKEFSEVTGLYGKEPSYYDQNLVLFSKGWSEGRYRFDPDGRLWLRWRKP